MNIFLEGIVYFVIAVFSMFFAYAMVGRKANVQHVISILTRLCISPDATAAEAAGVLGQQDENGGTKRRCTCLRRRPTRNRRLNRGGDVGDGSAVITRCVSEVNNAPSMVRNPSSRRSLSARGDTEVEGGRRAASNSAGGMSPNIAVVTPGESKGNDVTVDDRFEYSSVGVSKLGSAPDLAERNKVFFHTKKQERDTAAADIARETQAARSQLSPEARREVKKAEKAGKEHERARDAMNRNQMRPYIARRYYDSLATLLDIQGVQGGGQGQGRGKRTNAGGGCGETKGVPVVASNLSFPRSVSARGEEVEVDGERAARNSTMVASSSVAVATTRESKGDDETWNIQVDEL